MSRVPLATLVAAGREAFRPNAHALLVVPFVAWIAFTLRVFRLDAQNFWGDEAASYFFAKQSLSLLLQGLATAEPHPPLYYGLLHFVLPMAGREEYVLRFPSVLLGVTLVPLMYVLGRRLGGTALGCMAALLTALSPFQLWYSQETRHYMMVTTLGAASTYLLLRFLRRPGLGPSLVYGVATLLAMYTHYYGLFLPFAHAIYLSIRGGLLVLRGTSGQKPETRNLKPAVPWRRWALIQATVGALYLPWVVAASQVFFDYRKESPGELDLPALTWSFWLRQATGWSLDQQIAVPATLLLTCLVLAGGNALWQRGTLSLPLSWLLAPSLVPLVVSLVRPMYQERYLFITSPAFLLILAAALVARGSGALVAGTASLLTLGVFGVSLFHLYDDPQFIKGEYAPLTQMVDGAAAPGDAVALNGISQWYLYDYYRENDLPVYFLPPEQPLEPATIQAKLQEIERDQRGLWVIRAGVREYDPEGYVVNWLDTHYYRAGCQWARSGLACYYRLPPAGWAQGGSFAVSFGDELQLLAFRADRRTMAADDVLAFELEMAALRPAEDRKLFIHLVDAEGRLWGQNDAAPLNGARRSSELQAGERFVERRGLRPDPGVPPGSYTLLAGVYPESGGPRLALRPPSPASPDTLVLGKVEIDTPSRAPLPHPPPGFRAVNAAWPDGVRLLATRSPSAMGDGATASLRALWRAPGPLPGRRHALLTLVDGAG
ncbi:MAG: glycosyltransferase family 39 protein, partial [Chloroflexi bacterium]|nr:glycosyltransferase family 39 protein [Chloroflexota bacterium]